MTEEPPKTGYVRLYEDHTGRNYTDVTEAEYRRMCEDFANDPLAQILQEEITKAINVEIVASINKKA